MHQIEEFRNGYRFLSNFWMVPIDYEGIIYPSVEHAYQAAKTTVKEFKEAVSTCETPGQAKQLGQQLPMRPDWETVKLDVMYELLKIKFSTEFSHRVLRHYLLATGDAELIEGNAHGDVFWGVCFGNGRNHLGKLLMKLRAELQTRPTACPNCSDPSAC